MVLYVLHEKELILCLLFIVVVVYVVYCFMCPVPFLLLVTSLWMKIAQTPRGKTNWPSFQKLPLEKENPEVSPWSFGICVSACRVASQDVRPRGPNPWKVLQHYLSKKR